MVDFNKILVDDKRFGEIVKLLKEKNVIDVSTFMKKIEQELTYTDSLKIRKIILAVDDLKERAN